MKTIANTYFLLGAAVGFGAAFFGARAYAQAPAGIAGGSRLTAAVTPIHGSTERNGVLYGTWAAGSNYKVSFHDGATFVPLLGRDYPVRRSLHWHTQSATVGNLELVTNSPRLTHTERRAEYDLGSIVEAYDVLPEGVEQTFVLDAPVGAGDLTIRGRITTTLHADETAPRHASLSFVDDEGRELITYGEAAAIDASGRQCPMTTAYAEGVVTLRLPGSWLEQATYPVVVDPMLGSGGWVSDIDSIGDMDVARPSNGIGEQTWVSYSRYASATDGDIYLQRFHDDGSPGALAYSALSTANSERPSCAYVAFGQKVIVVFDTWIAQLGMTRSLIAHTHLSFDPSFGTNATAIGAPTNAWNADVGGTQVGGDGNKACIVWQQESQTGTFQESNVSSIQGFLYDVDTGVSTTPRVLYSAFFTDCSNPTVSPVSSSGSTNRWAVAWQSYYSLPAWPTWDVQARLFYGNDTLSPVADVMTSTGSHELGPKIAGSGDRWLLACTARGLGLIPNKPTATNGVELRTLRIDWPAFASQPTIPFGFVTNEVLPTSSIVLGGLAHHRGTDSHWALAWHDTLAGTVQLETVGYRGQTTQSEAVGSSPSGGSAATSAVAYNHHNGQFVAAYGVNFNSINYVQTNRFEFPSVQPFWLLGQSCSPATIWWHGSQYIGSDQGYLQVTGAAADALHLMAISTAHQTVPVGGIGPFASGCFLNINTDPSHFLGVFPIQVGPSPQWQLKLPESLTSDTYLFQNLHTIGNGNLQLVTSQQLGLPIAR